MPALRARWTLWGLLLAAAWPAGVRAFTHVSLGDPVDDVELRTLDGGRHHLLGKGAAANVVVFFRPQQEHSLDTLREMAACERSMAGKPVHWVAVVFDAWAPADVKAAVAATGLTAPVLWDEGDALYGKLGVVLHPSIGVVDGKHRLYAYEPFREINYCDLVRGRIQLLLGEITPAQFEKIEHPDRSVTRTDDGVARRHLNFARSLLRIHKHDKALAEVAKSLEILPSAAAYALQGQILAADGKCPEAQKAWDAALRLEPKNPDALDGRKACAP